MFISYCYFTLMRKLLSKNTKKSKSLKRTVFGKKILPDEEACAQIERLLTSDKPCMIARIGSVEMQAINDVYNVKYKLKKEISDLKVQILYNNAGFFPCEKELVPKFEEEYRKARANLDMIGLLRNSDEDYWIKYAPKSLQCMDLAALEPYYWSAPWSRALQGKKVLVINPFAKSIEKQYAKRELLFENKDILPAFTLKTFASVQSIGDNTGGFSDWFEALEYMKREIAQIDFDIAILGCGAYAFPLASFCKELGKKAVVMGGATQILFGIKGKRWQNAPKIAKLFNEHWVYPDQTEVPEGFQKVEGGCYW